MIQPPILADIGFDELVDEAIARIPAHTPEWTNPRLGDPGRTLIELFAWMTDSLLYRANLIPEKQRLVFLRLLGEQMQPAVPATGMVSLAIDNENATSAITIQPRAVVGDKIRFETEAELTVLPITAEAYCKRPLKKSESERLSDVIEGLQAVYKLDQKLQPYVTTPLFANGALEFDLIDGTVDNALWFALLASKAEQVEAVRDTLGTGDQLLTAGIVPAIAVPTFSEAGTAFLQRSPIPHVWEISGPSKGNKARYHLLDKLNDSTAGLTRQGSQRLVLPAKAFIGAPTNDVRISAAAGVGDRPPRLDDPDKAGRLVAWLRMRPTVDLKSLSLSWAGINCARIDQRLTTTNRVVGQSTGAPGQTISLRVQGVERTTFELQVEEAGLGYRPWRVIEDLALAQRDQSVYTLDTQAGSVQFGDGVNGRIPDAGARIRVAKMRVGGGLEGNLPANTLSTIAALDLKGNPISNLIVSQSIATDGGDDAESLAEAERRIPSILRHRDRAVTPEDFKRLASQTPGVRLGRVDVMPLFKPQTRNPAVPGVISVMVLPQKEAIQPPNPRPDRPILETVYSYLDERRLLGSELYVIGCEYIPLGVSVNVTIGDGFEREATMQAVREALRRFLWSLAPGGLRGEGWPRGRDVRDRELEVAVARVPGIVGVDPLNLFQREGDDWKMIARPTPNAPLTVPLTAWQLPELLSVVVVTDADQSPLNLDSVPNPFADESQIAVPIVPEVCY